MDLSSLNGTESNATINATNFSTEVNVQTCTFEKVISVLQNTGYLMSFIYLLRVYYYFWTKRVYTLQKKNLLSLCVNLWSLYALVIIDMVVKIPNFLVVISCCEITTTVLLLIMSLDTCLNLRQRARNRPMPLDDESEYKLFIFYTFCSWILSPGIAYTLAYMYDNFLIILIDFHLICYTLTLIMFFVSLYNIRPAATVNLGIGGSNRNFTIFGRTLIITFVSSSIKFAFAIIFYATGKQIDLLLLLDCLMAYDGVFIYYCLTFKNKKGPSRMPLAGGGTLQNVHAISLSRAETTSTQRGSALRSIHSISTSNNNHIHLHHHHNSNNNNRSNSNNQNRNTR